MQDISLQRCSNHQRREAVARCPECGYFFCRECITEHEGRVLCTNCLDTLAETQAPHRQRFQSVYKTLLLLMGLAILWVTFYYLGQVLLWLPDSFHEGTIWKI